MEAVRKTSFESTQINSVGAFTPQPSTIKTERCSRNEAGTPLSFEEGALEPIDRPLESVFGGCFHDGYV